MTNLPPLDWSAVQEIHARLVSYQPVSRMEIQGLIATTKAYREKFGDLKPTPPPYAGAPLPLETP